MAEAYWKASVFYGPGKSFWIREQAFTGVNAEDDARDFIENALENDWGFTIESPNEHEGAEVTVPISNINYTRLEFFEETIP